MWLLRLLFWVVSADSARNSTNFQPVTPFQKLFNVEPKERIDVDESGSDSEHDSNDSDNDDDDQNRDMDPGPMHSTFRDSADDTSNLDLHLSDDTIDPNEKSGVQQEPGTSFNHYRQRKRTESTGADQAESTSATPNTSFDFTGQHQFGGRQTPRTSFNASTSHDSTGNRTSSFNADDVFRRPQASNDSHNRSERQSRFTSRQKSPTRQAPRKSRQSTPIPDVKRARKTRSRRRSNFHEEILSAAMAGNCTYRYSKFSDMTEIIADQ